MKKKMLSFLALFSAALPCFAQEVLYQQTNKEVEYHYGIIADEDLDDISGTERIRNEFRTVERTVVKTINSNHQTLLDVTVLKNDYKQEWMTNLAERFVSDPNGITLKKADGVTIGRVDYTAEEIAHNNEIEEHIRTNGFHPGLTMFPVMTPELKSAMEEQGITVDADVTGYYFILTYPDDRKETYNNWNYTIIREFVDVEGVKTVETNGYEPYLINKGYLPRIRKTERFVTSINGPCITEVKLIYYGEYDIDDYAGFIDSATEQIENITVYPNPNTGLFNVNVKLTPSNTIIDCSVVNIITGASFPVNPAHASEFSVDMVDAEPGNYAVRVFTNTQTLSFHFFKQ